MESIRSAIVTNYPGSGWIGTLIGNMDIWNFVHEFNVVIKFTFKIITWYCQCDIAFIQQFNKHKKLYTITCFRHRHIHTLKKKNQSVLYGKRKWSENSQSIKLWVPIHTDWKLVWNSVYKWSGMIVIFPPPLKAFSNHSTPVQVFPLTRTTETQLQAKTITLTLGLLKI